MKTETDKLLNLLIKGGLEIEVIPFERFWTSGGKGRKMFLNGVMTQTYSVSDPDSAWRVRYEGIKTIETWAPGWFEFAVIRGKVIRLRGER